MRVFSPTMHEGQRDPRVHLGLVHLGEVVMAAATGK
jgi:hypothetical protein